MRIRTIKPEFWTDKRVASWDHFTRLLFIGLWSAADDKGRGSAEPERLAAALFPYDVSRDPSETLARLSRGLSTLSGESRITLYRVGDETFFEVAKWSDHQRIDNPGKSRIPSSCEGQVVNPRESLATYPETLAIGSGIRDQGTEEQGAGRLCRASARRDMAGRVLAHLNLKANRSFEPVEANLKPIACRLIDAQDDESGVLAMIDRQVAIWGSDAKMAAYLRPATLFNAVKFRSYYDDRNQPLPKLNGNHRPTTASERRNAAIGDDPEWQAQVRARIESNVEGFGLEFEHGAPPQDCDVGPVA